MIARRRLVGIGVSVVAACGAAVPALALSHAPRRTEAQNHQAAIRDASRLVQRVVLPPGSAPSSQEPSHDGGVLARPALTVGVTNLVDEHGWWTVDEPMPKVFRYEKSHPPDGGTVDTTCGSGGNERPPSTCVGSSFSPRRGVLGVRELVVEMVDLGNGTTGVRADAQVQWIVPRSASEVVPSGAKVVDIAAGGGKHYVVTEPSQVSRIVMLIDRLPTLQPGLWHCPAVRSDARIVRFDFRASRVGSALARASVRANIGNNDTGCDAMSFSIAGKSQTALVHARSFLRAVGQLLGVRLTERPGR
jgi:hypothetical protein